MTTFNDQSQFGPALADSSPAHLEGLQGLLRCPGCRGELATRDDKLVCLDKACGMRFPIVDQVPVLINQGKSTFTCQDFIARRNTTFDLSRSRFKVWLDHLLPGVGRNLKAKQNFQKFAELLLEGRSQKLVLVLGGSILGKGMEAVTCQPQIRLVETDVSFGPRTQIICDAGDLPFADASFHGVVVQAVIQYVPDPFRCVQEIERVLKPGGLVYAETAFMQQVVHGRHDFMRFTHLGVRRLFRKFEEVSSGIVCGPAMALAWSFHFFLLSFTARKFIRSLLHVFARLTLFWLKYLDPLLVSRPGADDAASGFFFLGKRGTKTLSDREIVALYQGAQE